MSHSSLVGKLGGGLAVVAAVGGFLIITLFSGPRTEAKQQSTSAPQSKKATFPIHAVHAEKVALDCSACHVPEQAGSVNLKRPGHDQCTTCHADAFSKELTPKMCGQCHTSFPPTSADDLLPYPRFKKERAILFEFAHASHVDPNGRTNPKTGFRDDCTFCHKFDSKGIFATFPGHSQCASCHSKAGMKPMLTPTSDTEECRGCHNPEEIENPGFSKDRRMIAPHVVSGVHVDLRYSHVAHFKAKEKYGLNCTTCHYAVLTSRGLANLTLPRMVDCVECHDLAKDIPAQFQMTNCSTCHIDAITGSRPVSHTTDVKPAFHNESFRRNHADAARAPGAKCFVCHINVNPAVSTNVSPEITGKQACVSCHQVMRPADHTARWRDDAHGKHAALDRTKCAECHTTDFCSRCHNLTPRSHQPLALFKAGAHRYLAMLDQRACMTCHTFENTCAACHEQKLRPPRSKLKG